MKGENMRILELREILIKIAEKQYKEDNYPYERKYYEENTLNELWLCACEQGFIKEVDDGNT